MALNVKQVVTVGLSLGLTTALGYHFLSSSPSTYTPSKAIQVRPLGSFDLAKTPEPKLPPIDEANEFQARQLSAQTNDHVDPSASYETLAAAETRPFNPTLESDQPELSAEPFALELSSPEMPHAAAAANEISDIDSTEFKFQSDDFNFDPGAVAETQAPAQEQQLNFVAAGQPDQETPAVHTAAPYSPPSSSSPHIEAGQPTKPMAGKWQGNPFATAGSAIPQTTENLIVARQHFNTNSIVAADVNQASNFEFATTNEFDLDSTDRVRSLNDPTRSQLPSEPFSVVSQTDTPNSFGNLDGSESRMPETLRKDSPSYVPQQIPLSKSVAQQAAQRIEYGKALSRRGAGYSARQEFLAAMQIIANANDNSTQSNRHSDALKKALLSIKEAADFSVATPEQQIHMDVASVVETHRSNILTPDEARRLPPVQVMNRYFSSAQKQLDLAGGRNIISSEAYFCLGKLNTMLTRNQKVPSAYDTAQSVVFHQAALLSDHSHHRSANELGVLLAKNGRLAQAKVLFERSLTSKPTVRTWQNLAEAHRRLGETDLASRANNEFKNLASRQVTTVNSEIQWMPVEQFNAEAPADINQQRIATRPAMPVNTQPSTQTPARKPSFTDRLKDLF